MELTITLIDSSYLISIKYKLNHGIKGRKMVRYRNPSSENIGSQKKLNSYTDISAAAFIIKKIWLSKPESAKQKEIGKKRHLLLLQHRGIAKSNMMDNTIDASSIIFGPLSFAIFKCH